MKRYIAKRLLQLIPILLGITLFSFLLMNTGTADVIDVMENNTGSALWEEEKNALREELGLDRPLLLQYVIWLGKTVRGDMGESFVSGQPVSAMFVSKLPATIGLMITSILLTVFLSVPLGILSAVRQNRITDYLIRFFSFIGNSLPNFFVSLLLIWFFSLKLKLLPVMGNNAGWKSVILPTLTLALSMASRYTRQVRATVLEELNKDY
jgi:peptide/nickel transport system permease protein